MGYYDEIAPSYDRLHEEEQLKKLQLIRENLDIRKSDKLLDVGCGTGFSLEFFDCDCTGVDPSAGMAGQSRNNIIIASAENLPFADNSFDIVLCITAIHNFEDIEKSLREMKRAGKKKFAFSVLKKAKSFEMIKRLIHRHFKIEKEIEEEKDAIFICSRQPALEVK